MRVRADGDRVANCEMRLGRERRRHCRGRFSRRHHMQRPAGYDFGDFRIGQGARDHTTSADRVDTGADNGVKILLESGNGNRQ